MAKKQQMYAEANFDDKGNFKWYDHFYLTKFLVSCCGASEDKVHKVELREAEEDEKDAYWGWEDFEDNNEWMFIFPSRILLDMCFPSGVDLEAKLGRGRSVRLIVERIQE